MQPLFRLPTFVRGIVHNIPPVVSRGLHYLPKRNMQPSTSRPSSAPSTIADRNYGDAIRLLGVLQSNRAIASSISSSNVDMNALAIPEMIDWTRKAGYELDDFTKAGLKCIHVAGTKGKGSVCIMVESILAQYQKEDMDSSMSAQKKLDKIGVYTSPHLITTCERIRINGSPISEDLFTKYFFELWDRFTSAASTSNPPHPDPESAETKPGYFRFLTIMAFHTFLREGVETAIIECGIGGEYDSTNILPAEAVTTSAITKLGIDHVGMLGGTIEEIAWHKAGVMKSGVPAFTIRQDPKAQTVLETRAAEKDVKLVTQDRLSFFDRSSQIIGLDGDFQKDNASLAVAVATNHLKSVGLLSDESITPDTLPEQFQLGLKIVQWPGRCQVREEGNIIWMLDGAHTHDSVQEAAEWYFEKLDLRIKNGENLESILMFSQQDRDAVALLRALLKQIHSHPAISYRAFNYAAFPTYTVFSTSTDSGDAVQDEDLSAQEKLAEVYSLTDRNNLSQAYGSIEQAIKLVKTISEAATEGQKVVVLVTGSLYLVSGVLQNLDPCAEKKAPVDDSESATISSESTEADLNVSSSRDMKEKRSSTYNGTNSSQFSLHSILSIRSKLVPPFAAQNQVRCQSTKVQSILQKADLDMSSVTHERHSQPWTPEEDTELSRMRAEKIPYKTIGMLLQRSKDACQSRYRGITSIRRPESWSPPTYTSTSPWTDEETHTLLEKRALRLSWKDIGFILGRSPDACRTRHGRVTVQEDDPNKSEPLSYWNKTEDKQLLELRARGLTFSKIATQSNRSVHACRNRFLLLTSSKAKVQNWEHWTIEELTQLVDSRAAGTPLHSIATQLKRSYSSVKNQWRYLRKNGETLVDLESEDEVDESLGV